MSVPSDEHERAVKVAARWTGSCEPQPSTHAIIAAYFAELERQGVRMVPLAEATAALRTARFARRSSGHDAANFLERRFGGDER